MAPQPSDEKAIIVRPLEGMPVGQRAQDGYINATAMCQAAGKLWGNYYQTQTTQDFLAALASDIGIPISLLIHSVRGGKKDLQGTWVHPLVAVNLAQWCSAQFAVQVSKWVVEWATTGTPPLNGKIPVTHLIYDERLQKSVSLSYHHLLARLNGNFVHANADLCKAHSDWRWWPKDYKAWARSPGWKWKDRQSGLAVLRRKEKASAGAITFEKVMVLSGAQGAAAREMAQDFKALARKMLAHGVTCAELEYTPGEEAAGSAAATRSPLEAPQTRRGEATPVPTLPALDADPGACPDDTPTWWLEAVDPPEEE